MINIKVLSMQTVFLLIIAIEQTWLISSKVIKRLENMEFSITTRMIVVSLIS